jgi:hypothetical protein
VSLIEITERGIVMDDRELSQKAFSLISRSCELGSTSKRRRRKQRENVELWIVLTDLGTVIQTRPDSANADGAISAQDDPGVNQTL